MWILEEKEIQKEIIKKCTYLFVKILKVWIKVIYVIILLKVLHKEVFQLKKKIFMFKI